MKFPRPRSPQGSTFQIFRPSLFSISLAILISLRSSSLPVLASNIGLSLARGSQDTLLSNSFPFPLDTHFIGPLPYHLLLQQLPPSFFVSPHDRHVDPNGTDISSWRTLQYVREAFKEFRAVEELSCTGLTLFGQLQELCEMCQHVGRDTIRVVETTLWTGYDNPFYKETEIVLPTITSLRLSMFGSSRRDTVIFTLPAIAKHFPSLVHLNIWFRFVPAMDFRLFERVPSTSFPNLKSLHVTIQHGRQWAYELSKLQIEDHMEFLRDHPQLEELSLPPSVLLHSSGSSFVLPQTVLPSLPHLRILRASLNFALLLAPSYQPPSGEIECQVEELFLDHAVVLSRLPFDPFETPINPSHISLWPYKRVRKLAIMYSPFFDRPKGEFVAIKAYFSWLEELELFFHQMPPGVEIDVIKEWNDIKKTFIAEVVNLKVVRVTTSNGDYRTKTTTTWVTRKTGPSQGSSKESNISLQEEVVEASMTHFGSDLPSWRRNHVARWDSK